MLLDAATAPLRSAKMRRHALSLCLQTARCQRQALQAQHASRRAFSSDAPEAASAAGAAAGAPAPPPPPPPPPADAAAALRAEVADLTKKLKEAKDAHLYQLAEMENVRRIASADVRRAREYACQPMAKSLLLALDNLDSALRAAAPAQALLAAGGGGGGGGGGGNGGEAGGALAKPFGDLVEGLRATHRIFVKVLGEHGAVQFGAAGDKFDPHKFDAISLLTPAADGAGPQAGHVHTILQSGYMFKDRVLRPCQCLVVEGKAK